jgi:hypothetical protein
MHKALFFIVSLASLALSAQRTLFVQVPSMRYWTAGNPVLVENGDGVVHQMQDAGGNGWFSYTWENVEPSDNVYVYSSRDSLLKRPLGLNYYKGAKEQTPIPVNLVMETYGVDSIYYIPDDLCWPDDGVDQGIYPSDVRGESSCNGDYDRIDSESVSTDIYVVFPSYDEWDNDIPVIVDADDFENTWEMRSEGSKKFFYSWNDDEWYPENILIFMKSDSLLEHPIGSKGFTMGLQSGLQGDYIGEAFSIRNCFLNDLAAYSPTLNPGYKPACYIYLAPTALIYSVTAEKGSLVVPERRSMDSTEIAYLEGRALLINKDIPLEDGNYVLKYAVYDYDNKPVDGQIKFTVKDGEYRSAVPARSSVSQIQAFVAGRNLLISSTKQESYAVFNLTGQIIARGRLAGLTSVALPAPGVYLIKVGGELHRVNVQ